MRNAARVATYGTGVLFVLAGVFGFVQTRFEHWFAADTDAFLLVFELNPLHNVAHVALGAVLLVAASGSERAARLAAAAVGAGYVLLALYGVVLGDDPSWNVLALNTADDVLHGVTGVALLLAAFASFSTARPRVRRAR